MNDRAKLARAFGQCIAPADDESRFDGISRLITDRLGLAGAADVTLATGADATLVGWFQESTQWELVARRDGTPILAVTYTLLTAGSDKNSVDDHASRILGIAKDTQLAQRKELLPLGLRRAHVHVQELTRDEEHASFLGEEAIIMCSRMRDMGLYHAVWAVGVTPDQLSFTEPTPALDWPRFAADLHSDLLPIRTSPSPWKDN